MSILSNAKRIRIDLSVKMTSSSYKGLSIKHESQIYDNWCWAACGVMLLNYHLALGNRTKPVSQCNFAYTHKKLAHIKKDLCVPKNENYNVRMHFKEMEYTLESGYFSQSSSKIDFYLHHDSHLEDHVDSIINDYKLPILASLENYPDSPGGHMVVVSGYETKSRKLHLHDPDFGFRTRSFNNFKTNYLGKRGKWRYSWT